MKAPSCVIALIACLVAPCALASHVTVPNTFAASTPAVAAQVNANFAALATGVNDNDSRISALETALASLQQTVASQQTTINTLQTRLATVQNNTVLQLDGKLGLGTVDGYPTARFSAVNVQIVNGTGGTINVNGLGNLTIGYNEASNSAPLICSNGYPDQSSCAANGGTWARNQHSASHNLIVGAANAYTSFGGILGGVYNATTNQYDSVLGGIKNIVSGQSSAVCGGGYNVITASAQEASITGGEYNTVSGVGTTVSGGTHNLASGNYAAVSGGSNNTASGIAASVSGGGGTDIQGIAPNQAIGDSSWIGGGQNNTASGINSAISGGYLNIASQTNSSVSGGYANTASGDYASVSGGGSNNASGVASSASGGNNNIASAYDASVCGGWANQATSDRIFANGFDPCCRVGGTVAGLSGSGLVPHLIGSTSATVSENLAVSHNGLFDFVTNIPTGDNYGVTIHGQRTGQTCTVTHAAGTMGSSDIDNVAVTCGAMLFWGGGQWGQSWN